MLVPRIVASGRAWLRNAEIELCVEDLPDCAEAPFALLNINACGSSDWEFLTTGGRRRIIRVTIPVTARIRDCNGCVHTVHSSVTVDVPIRMGMPRQNPCHGGSVTVLPTIRLVCAPVCSDDNCFTVRLDVLVDVYVTRWEPSSDGITVPCRPDLPLNLPLNFPSCCR
ncbi:MAG: hypothetical protein IJZ74_03895 [Clostridia bacterium]|nr:hypothetical protein [Clostridia bacterium]